MDLRRMRLMSWTNGYCFGDFWPGSGYPRAAPNKRMKLARRIRKQVKQATNREIQDQLQ